MTFTKGNGHSHNFLLRSSQCNLTQLCWTSGDRARVLLSNKKILKTMQCNDSVNIANSFAKILKTMDCMPFLLVVPLVSLTNP